MSAKSATGSPWLDSLERSGFTIIERVMTAERIAVLIEAIRAYAAGGHDGALDRRGEVYGGRDLLWRVAEVRSLARWYQPAA